jgi:hypothetical protein
MRTRSEDTFPRSLPEGSGPVWMDPGRGLMPRIPVQTASRRVRDEIMASLLAAGLSEDQSGAETTRLLAGDVWAG